MTEQHIGAIWRKWDLHVHTPASVVQNYGGNNEEAWQAFLADLEALPAAFKVIGINDYIFVDGYERVLKEKRAGRLRNIDLFLPVVELRLDKFAGVVKKDEVDGTYSKSDWNRVNLHVIFDQLEPEVIRQQFLGSLVQCYDIIPDAIHLKGKWQAVITPDSLKKLGQMVIEAAPEAERTKYGSEIQEGFNNLCVSFDKVLDALNKHDLNGRYLLAVGKAEWENMKWTDQSIAEKRNVINKVDIVFTASENPETYDKAKRKLTESNVLDRLLDCSDAHDYSSSIDKDRIGNCFTWIKADPTFRGLQQAVAEFDQRVFVGDTPPKHLLVQSNRTKYASSITIKRKIGSTFPDPWFDVKIPLSHDLVAIIGNKGSGKSALADVVSLVGDTQNFKSFSFLNERRFRDPRNNISSHFVGSIRWEDTTESQLELDKNPAVSSVERIKYLPQSYLEELCNELADSNSATFDDELRKIIFTHVPEEQRLGLLSLDELLDFKISQIQAERKQLLEALSKHNREIAAVELKLSSEYRQSLEQQLDAKKRELAALENAVPISVEDPQGTDAARQEAEAAAQRLSDLEILLADFTAQEQEIRRKKAAATKSSAHIGMITQAIINHQKIYDQFIGELDGMLKEVPTNLRASDIFSMTVNANQLEQLRSTLRDEISEFDRILTDVSGDGIIFRRQAAEEQVKAERSQLGEKQRLFLVYKEQLTKWENAKIAIHGDKDKQGSIGWYVDQISLLDNLPQERDGLKVARIEIVRQLHEQLGKVVAEYKLLYEPVQSFVQSAEKMDMPLPLDFDVRISEFGFQDSFLNRLNRQTRGSFSGIEESNNTIRRILKESDFMNLEGVIAFLEKIDSMLHFDKRVEVATPVELQVIDQLRKGSTTEELYDFLFGLEYLKPHYSLTYDGQEISQLSPGERGLLLLVFYLLVDNDDIPLVIDQPEENLDNQTIFKILVTCIKAAKRRRQVIMVTHNPNLAVVCDAEQIICASCDKVGRAFSYISGAIESQPIRERVIEILEGTEPAFVNRKNKYGF